LYNSTFIFAKTISETIHWLLAVEYFTVVNKFPLIKITGYHSNPNEIDAKAKRANNTIRFLNIIFYTLVIACFIVGGYFYLNLYHVSIACYNAWLFFDSVLKLISGLLIVYSLIKFKGLLKRMR
jgi:hypothetical protein